MHSSHLVLFIFYICSGIQSETGAETVKRPHIIFILADDLGWNDVSFHGSLQIPTPNIDTLAANGIVLNNYYVQHMCSPSRAALLTGRHPIHLGMQQEVIRADQPAGLPLDVKLLPEYLKDLGYATHALGKWHLGFYKKEYTPTYRGFDSFLGTWLHNIDYYDHTFHRIYDKKHPEKFLWGRALRENMEPADKYIGKYLTDLLTDRAIDIISKHNSSQPLFLYFPHLAVHAANMYRLYQSPVEEIRRMRHVNHPERILLAGMISRLDQSVGKVFRELEKRGMLENSIFVFSTDNGGSNFPVYNGVASNWPLKGSKGTMWEGAVRGTAVIWSRLLKRRRRISNQLMHITDWLPTLYHAAGGNLEHLGNIYGQDLWKSLSLDIPSPRTEILHNIDPVAESMSLRRGGYKLVNGTHYGGILDVWSSFPGRNNPIRHKKYVKRLKNCDIRKVLKKRRWLVEVTDEFRSEMEVKCARGTNLTNFVHNCIPTKSPCLFDVEKDPCEQENIAEKNPRIVESMLQRLKELGDSAAPLVNRTLDPRANPLLHSFLWTNWADDS